MSNQDGKSTNQPGPQQHAEGQHGEKTHAAFTENLHTRQPGVDDAESAQGSGDYDEYGRPKPGHHRLHEDRQQHDAAEKDSEIKHNGG